MLVWDRGELGSAVGAPSPSFRSSCDRSLRFRRRKLHSVHALFLIAALQWTLVDAAMLQVVPHSYKAHILSASVASTARYRRLAYVFLGVVNSRELQRLTGALVRTLAQVASTMVLIGTFLLLFALIALTAGVFTYLPRSSSSSPDSLEGALMEVRAAACALFGRRRGTPHHSARPNPAIPQLTVLITTANFPDIMLPAYGSHRPFAYLYILIFVPFLLIGLFFLMNLALARVFDV